MIILPDVKHYERPVQTISPNRDILPIYAALRTGVKRFREEEFVCTVPKDHERDSSVLHMSSSGHCGRKEWLHLHHTDEYDESEAILRLRIPPPYTAFHFGHIIEAYTLHLLRLGGLTPFNEQKELSDLGGKITGHIDAMVTISGTEYLVEVKGLKGESVELLNCVGVRKALPGYFFQMQYYMFCLELDFGYLIVLDKNSSAWYIELVRRDEESVRFLRQKVLALSSLQTIEGIPEKFIYRDCRFCALIEKCAQIEGQEQFIQNFVAHERSRP